jgi:hypothetical protein
MAFLPADLEVPTLLETDRFRLRPISGGSPTRAGSPSRTGQLLDPGQPGQGVHDQVDGVATPSRPRRMLKRTYPADGAMLSWTRNGGPRACPG